MFTSVCCFAYVIQKYKTDVRLKFRTVPCVIRRRFEDLLVTFFIEQIGVDPCGTSGDKSGEFRAIHSNIDLKFDVTAHLVVIPISPRN